MNNVDTSEINKFDRLAEQWWDLGGEFKTLHEINPLRLNYIEHHSGGLRDKNIVDVGCGGGILAESLAKGGAKVTGIDLAADTLSAAGTHAESQNLNIDYQRIEVETFAREHAGQFDIVSCMEMLEHVPDPKSIVAACAALCKPGGQLFFSTINRSAKAFLAAIVGAEYVLKLLPRGTHDYLKFIRPSELAAWARQAMLDMQDLSGVHYDPFRGKHAINDDISVNYLMYCRKRNE